MTATLKLRVSMLSQATAAALRSRGLAGQAGGLGYIKSQPTADRKILTGFGNCGVPAKAGIHLPRMHRSPLARG
jgi:hypothetical protein